MHQINKQTNPNKQIKHTNQTNQPIETSEQANNSMQAQSLWILKWVILVFVIGIGIVSNFPPQPKNGNQLRNNYVPMRKKAPKNTHVHTSTFEELPRSEWFRRWEVDSMNSHPTFNASLEFNNISELRSHANSGKCDPPKGTPRYCCVGSSSTGGAPSWSPTYGCSKELSQYYNYKPDKNHKGMRQVIHALAGKNHSLTLVGDSTSRQHANAAVCDALRDGCSMNESFDRSFKGEPTDYHYGVREVVTWDITCGADTVKVRFYFIYRPRLNITDTINMLEAVSPSVVEFSFGAHYLTNMDKTALNSISKVPDVFGDTGDTLDVEWDKQANRFGRWALFAFEMNILLKTFKTWQSDHPNDGTAFIWRDSFAQHFKSIGGEWTEREAEGCRGATDIQYNKEITPNIRKKILFALADDIGLDLGYSANYEFTRSKRFNHPWPGTDKCDGTHYCSNPLFWKPMYNNLYNAMESMHQKV